jgi:transposase
VVPAGEHVATPLAVSKSTVYRHLGLQDITTKALEPERVSQNSPSNKLLRSRWVRSKYEAVLQPLIYNSSPLVRSSVVFVDETNWNLHFHRRRGWARRGERAKLIVPRDPEEIVTLVLAVNREGVVQYMIKDGGATRYDLVEFFLKLHDLPMVRDLECQAMPLTIVWDNAPPHHSGLLTDPIDKTGVFDTLGWRVVYTPPYSPELNPVENVFGMLKARVLQCRQSIFNRVDLKLEVTRQINGLTGLDVKDALLHWTGHAVPRARRGEDM